MNVTRLLNILGETTREFRKGEVFEGTPALVKQVQRVGIAGLSKIKGGGELHIYAMPHVSEVPDELETVDVEFMVIGVDKAAAERHRAELIEILKSYPQPDRLAGGPSYIEVGAAIGDQGAAFRLFALGKVLGLWNVITPAIMGATGAEARELAGRGFVMITGFKDGAAHGG